ncbi:hypothetical protein BJ170DRAFT_402032 [Xylariales sp. AK1849]|nr:hypothetical protein BJ170DRAFT_402032 [Xylariales sp. AK1849]
MRAKIPHSMRAPYRRTPVQPYTETALGQDDESDPSRLVHFDIDPGNVFVGSLRSDPEHLLHPIVKLGDYGIMEDMSDESLPNEIEDFRRAGKGYSQAPEQFLTNSELLKIGLPTDKNIFGVHTNVWGIGVVMFSLIMRATFLDNPHAKGATVCRSEDGSELARTYGWLLLDNQNKMISDHLSRSDSTLRETVAHCLCEHPADRPTLQLLEEAILDAIQYDDAIEANGKSPPGETNARMQEFVGYFFTNAPDKPDPGADYWHLAPLISDTRKQQEEEASLPENQTAQQAQDQPQRQPARLPWSRLDFGLGDLAITSV